MPEIFVGEPFSASLFSGIEKIYASEDYVMIFRRNFFVSQYRNFSSGNPLVFLLFQESKNVQDTSKIFLAGQ